MATESGSRGGWRETGWADGLIHVLLGGQSLWQRLGELRVRIFRAALALAVTSLLAWIFYGPILSFLVRPLKALPGADSVVTRGTLIFTAPTEAFFVRIKIVLFAGTALASPIILWQVWRFLTSGLGERGARSARVTLAVVAVSVILFAAGTALAFAFVGPALHIFLYLGGSHVVLIPRATEYLSFLLLLIVAFGLTFEYPLFLLALILTGVISSATLRKRRRGAWFLLMVVSAVVTPTVDPITPLALALPLALLYEATIATARFLKH